MRILVYSNILIYYYGRPMDVFYTMG